MLHMPLIYVQVYILLSLLVTHIAVHRMSAYLQVLTLLLRAFTRMNSVGMRKK